MDERTRAPRPDHELHERLRRGGRERRNGERDREIRRRYAEGETLASLGRQFDLSRQRVEQIVKWGGFNPGRKRVSV